MKIAVIGGKTTAIGFKALGLETFPVERPADALEVWGRLNLEEFGIIFVTEPIYEVLREELEPLAYASLPVVSVIPAVSQSRGVMKAELRKLVEKAVGTELAMR